MYQKRLEIEKEELDVKRDKLREFMSGATYRTLAKVEQSRLQRQLGAMALYSGILAERIDAFSDR